MCMCITVYPRHKNSEYFRQLDNGVQPRQCKAARAREITTPWSNKTLPHLRARYRQNGDTRQRSDNDLLILFFRLYSPIREWSLAAERSDRGQGGTVRAAPRLSLTPKTAARNKKGYTIRSTTARQ